MPLHPTMKRRLHERLHPLIGDEEADALLDQISPPDPVTREWLQERFDLIDLRFEHVDRSFEQVDRSFEQVDRRFEEVDRRLDQVDRQLEQVDRRFDDVDRRFEQVGRGFEDVGQRVASLDGRFATKEWIEGRFYDKDALDMKLASMEDRILKTMADRFTQHTVLTVAGLGGAATIISVVQAIWG